MTSARMAIGDVIVDLCSEADVIAAVRDRLSGDSAVPIAIGSVNLDHLHHFADQAESQPSAVDWLMLPDGAPIVFRANRLTGRKWPRLTGADLLATMLGVAESAGHSVGFLGGAADMHEELKAVLAQRFPRLQIVGYWAPERAELADPALPESIRSAGPEVLIVGLGKPRQEQWIDRFGATTGAGVLLAFGAAADFLAGRVTRAPQWMQNAGLEWLYRLGLEPRRLARRYLVQGPPALNRLRRATLVGDRR